MMELTRRNFVQAAGAATAAAALAAGATTALADEAAAADYSGTGYVDPAADGKEPTIIDYTNVVEEVGEPAEVEEHEIIVVGAGGTGLAAGIQAFEDGLDVVAVAAIAVVGYSPAELSQRAEVAKVVREITRPGAPAARGCGAAAGRAPRGCRRRR